MYKWSKIREYQKGIRIINSCETLEQKIVAHNWVGLFGKKYGFCRLWSDLDKSISSRIDYELDSLVYKERMKFIESELC